MTSSLCLPLYSLHCCPLFLTASNSLSRFMSDSRSILESEFLLTECSALAAFCGLTNPLCSSSVSAILLIFLPVLLSHLFCFPKIGSIYLSNALAHCALFKPLRAIFINPNQFESQSLFFSSTL